MSDPVGPAPATGLLEGLAEGFQGGYGFREGVKGRRRAQQLQADLMTLRQQEAARQEAHARREETVFDEQQLAYRRAEALRTEVAAHLAGPGRYRTLGAYVSGAPAEHTRPLSPEAQMAQRVGRTLGEFGGRDLSPDESLLVGSGQVPYQAVAPRTYHPRTRAEWLENLKIAAGLRGQGTRLPITMDHAFAVLDRIYTVQDPHTGEWRSHLSPGQRLKVAKKMVDGTVQSSDFPDLPDESAAPPGGPAPAAAPGGHGLLGWKDWMRSQLGPGGGAAPARPAGGAADYGVQEPAADADRLEQARLLVNQYRDLPQEDLEGALREQGYSDEEIDAVLGSPAGAAPPARPPTPNPRR